MNDTYQALMRDATRLTQSGQLTEATAAIQRALGGATQRPLAPRPVPAGAPLPWVERVPAERFSAGAHTEAGLTRHYKLFVPPDTGRGAAHALVVMLHGCTQDPDDFATGTGMNRLAAEQGFAVLYPAQAQEANPSRCWNWFKHNHQARGHGEAAVIAGMTQAVVRAQGIDPGRVYIAGLSAGGAMAGLVAAAYPELFAAVGVHSGLAPGAARSLPEGLAAMRHGGAGAQGHTALPVPTIVFHGDHDEVVHARNGEQLIAAARRGAVHLALQDAPSIEQAQSAQGRRYTRSLHGSASGAVVAEHWLLHGAGHAWSGGDAAGSYTDPRGPDASAEMLRFFFSQPRPASAAGSPGAAAR
jgi:poly(hydroxyalkanoate) depolymerase family esterase